MILDSLYKLAGVLSAIVVIMGIPFRFMWGRLHKVSERLEEHDKMLNNRFTKQEAGEEIDRKIIPLQQSIENLNVNITHLTESVNAHSQLVRDIQMWQQREIGRKDRGNGGYDSS